MCLRARLAAKELTKIEGIYFGEVYCQVSSYTTVRLVMSMLVKQKHKRQLLDVKNEFESQY